MAEPRRVYLDHAATSFPKLPGVVEAMTRFTRELSVAPGRGSYSEVIEAERLVTMCRERINQLINGEAADHVVFTLNCSDALNMAIKGLILPGRDNHAVITDMAHNSVLRPLNELESRGLSEQTRVPCDPGTGLLDPDDIARAIRPETKFVAIEHGSNVTGTIQPIDEIGRICRETGVVFLVDAAQTAGHVPIDVQATNIDLLAFPGHKGLLGPLGTGGLYIRPGLEHKLATYREGGTGSVSEDDMQPAIMPDRFEPGSHNSIGIVGLSEGVQWILEQTVEALWAHERRLIIRFLERLSEVNDYPGLALYGPADSLDRCGVFSIRVKDFEPQEMASILESSFGILTRAGLHCAPRAHKTIGTFDRGGTIRLSFGPLTLEEDVDYLCDSLSEVCVATASSAPLPAPEIKPAGVGGREPAGSA